MREYKKPRKTSTHSRQQAELECLPQSFSALCQFAAKKERLATPTQNASLHDGPTCSQFYQHHINITTKQSIYLKHICEGQGHERRVNCVAAVINYHSCLCCWMNMIEQSLYNNKQLMLAHVCDVRYSPFGKTVTALLLAAAHVGWSMFNGMWLL